MPSQDGLDYSRDSQQAKGEFKGQVAQQHDGDMSRIGSIASSLASANHVHCGRQLRTYPALLEVLRWAKKQKSRDAFWHTCRFGKLVLRRPWASRARSSANLDRNLFDVRSNDLGDKRRQLSQCVDIEVGIQERVNESRQGSQRWNQH